MKVRLQLNIGSNDVEKFPRLKKSQRVEGVHDVDEETAEQLIERGWAVPEGKPIKAVPESSTINT